MVRLIAALALAFFMPLAQANTPVVKISVLSSGTLLLNGKISDLATIENEFKKLKQGGGAVWYYREAPETEPPPQGMAVIQLVVKYKLPVSMSTKPDFSDYVDENGVSQPRKH